MKPAAGKAGRLALGALVTCVMTLSMGCGGGSDGDTIPPAVTASFTESSSTAAANVVRLRSASASGNLVELEVAIGGVTTSGDLYSFAFDLVLSNPTVASYVTGTATVGDVFILTAGQTSGTQAATSGSRLVVGVSKFGPGLGNGVTVPEAVVVRLTFRVLKVGTTNVTFAGHVSPQTPTGDPAALDSTLDVIPSVQFDSDSAVITGS